MAHIAPVDYQRMRQQAMNEAPTSATYQAIGRSKGIFSGLAAFVTIDKGC